MRFRLLLVGVLVIGSLFAANAQRSDGGKDLEALQGTWRLVSREIGGRKMTPEETVAALDTKYQAAVKANDAATMDQILADNFVLVTGRGSVFSKADLLDSARKKEVTYEHQDEEPGTQKVRVWGDTAVVTALLWIKSVQAGKPADYKLWFSDTYVRTPTGWRYVFGQASLPLSKAEHQ
jgi:ketosteroid isomerase-like protein